MKKFKSIFFIVLLCLLLVVIYLRKKTSDNSDQYGRRLVGLQRLLSNAKTIHRIWNEGEDSREWGMVRKQCLKKFGITEAFDESLLRCHPFLIACVDEFLSKNPVKIKNSSYNYPAYIYTLVDQESHEQLKVSLSDQCHELYLEPKIYTYGLSIKGAEDFQFDNFNQHLYFDQHLVTNSEISEWNKYDSLSDVKFQANGNNLFLPATQLTLKQMHNFCSFKGKQLMLSSLFDAATFLTQDKTRSPFYWTKKQKEQNIGCDFIYSQECLKDKKWKINSSPPSWAGLYDSMGGVFEVTRNTIDSESNLKVSSFYFPKNSPWHRLGFRAYWDGEGNSQRNFNFKGIDPVNSDDKFQVGFRCMREVAP
jgi:hypothetical protein